MRPKFFPRLILLVSLAAWATSAYVVSGFLGTPKPHGAGGSRTTISDVVSGFVGTPKPQGAGGSRTSIPSNTPDDGVWQTATHVATTSGSSFRVRTQHIPLASYAHSSAVLIVGNARICEFPNVVRDRSPQHSLPLLI
ncbi:MAG TPA: hypothetical protein VF456_19350 [Vicinamibacterales bacterium]